MATYRNTLVQIRQWMASELGDLVLGAVTTDASNSTTVAVLGSTTPPQFYNQADSYFSDNKFESYCYEGTNIGTSQTSTAWANSTRKLTLLPAAAAAFIGRVWRYLDTVSFLYCPGGRGVARFG